MSAGGLGMKIRAANAFVTLGVQDNLSKGLSLAERKLRDFGQRAAGMASKLAGASLAVAGPGLISSQVFGGFEQTMARVRGLTNATKDEFTLLWQEAKRLGAETQFTARDAAKGMAFYAQAGFKVTEIHAAMLPTLDLAAAGQLDVAESADILAKIMHGMGVPATDLTYHVDVLTKAMQTANTDLRQLGEAFKYAGAVAKTAGLSFEETTAFLQLMSNAGIQADMAGTTLRGALLALTSPSVEAQKELEKLKIDTEDANGNFLSLAEIIGQFESAMAGMGTGQKLQILGKIFDNRQASGFAEAIAQGGDVLKQMTESLRDSSGAAARFRNIQMNTLAGQWELFTSAIETLQITLGEIAAKPLRSLLRGLTDVVVGTIRFAEANQWVFVLLGVIGGLLVTGAAYFLALSFTAMAAQAAVQLFGFAVSAVRVALLSVSVSMTVLTGLTKVFQFAFIAASITVLSLRSATIATSAALVSFAVSTFVVQNAIFLAVGFMRMFSVASAGVMIAVTATRAAIASAAASFVAFSTAIWAAVASIKSVQVTLSATYFAIAALFNVLVVTKAAVMQFQLAMMATRTAFQAVIIVTVTANGVATTYKLTLLSLQYTTAAYNVMAKLMASYLVAVKVALFAAAFAVEAKILAMEILTAVTVGYRVALTFISSVLGFFRVAAIASAIATQFLAAATYAGSVAMRVFSVATSVAQYAITGLSFAVRGLGIAIRFLANPWVSLTAAVTAAFLLIEHAMSSWSVSVQGAGGEWGKLFEHVKWTIQGIYDAIVAGKWDLAFKILMSGAKLALSEGLIAVSAMFGMSIEETSRLIAELYKQFMQVVTKVNRWRAEASNWIAQQIGNVVGVDVQEGDSAALAAAAEWETAINNIDTSTLAQNISEALDPETQMQALNDLLGEAALAADQAFQDPEMGPKGDPRAPGFTPTSDGVIGTAEAANFASIGNFSAATLSRQLPGAKDKTTQIATNTKDTVKELQKIGATIGGMGFAFGP